MYRVRLCCLFGRALAHRIVNHCLLYRFLTEAKRKVVISNQKTMSLWQHQELLMYAPPNISRPATAGTNSLYLSWTVLVGVRPLLVPRESAASNLQKPAALQPFLLAASLKCTDARNAIPDRPSPRVTLDRAVQLHILSTVETHLGRRRTQLLTIAQWNAMNLIDREGPDWSEIRMTLVAMELDKYNIYITALCETRVSDSGSLNDLEYSFFWSGKPEGRSGLCYQKGYRDKADQTSTASKWQHHEDETTTSQ